MAEARYKREWRLSARAKRTVDHLLNIYLEKTTFVFDAAMGARLSEVRQQMGLSQKKFGERLGVSQSYVCRVETGKSDRLPMNSMQFMSALPEYYRYVLFGSAMGVEKQEKPSENVWVKKKREQGAKN